MISATMENANINKVRHPNFLHAQKATVGVPGFEPGNTGIKTQCLTAWRHPTNQIENE